jgi:hypothetical protein
MRDVGERVLVGDPRRLDRVGALVEDIDEVSVPCDAHRPVPDRLDVGQLEAGVVDVEQRDVVTAGIHGEQVTLVPGDGDRRLVTEPGGGPDAAGGHGLVRGEPAVGMALEPDYGVAAHGDGLDVNMAGGVTIPAGHAGCAAAIVTARRMTARPVARAQRMKRVMAEHCLRCRCRMSMSLGSNGVEACRRAIVSGGHLVLRRRAGGVRDRNR